MHWKSCWPSSTFLQLPTSFLLHVFPRLCSRAEGPCVDEDCHTHRPTTTPSIHHFRCVGSTRRRVAKPLLQLLRTTARASCSAAPSATTPRCAATRPGTATPAAAARRPGTCALGGRRQGGGAAERQLQPLRWTSDRERSSNVTAASMAWVRPLVLHLRRRPPRHRGRHTRRGE
jgi:hypothetical protein